MEKILFNTTITRTKIAIFITAIFAISTANQSIARGINITTHEPITGNTPTGDADLILVMSDAEYSAGSVIFVSPDQTPSDIQFNGSLSNVVVSDIDGDLTPSISTAHSATDPIQYRWFNGTTEITDSLTSFTSYKGMVLTLEVTLPVVVSTETGFPRNNLGENDRPSQSIISRFNVAVEGQSPLITVNGTNFSLIEDFPKTGFEGASFTLKAPYQANLYSWRSSEPNLAKVDSYGEVTLLKMPENSDTHIKIIAEPSIEGLDTFEYKFNLAQWFIHAGDQLANRMQNGVFCSEQEEGNYMVPSLQKNLLYGSKRAANGRLWNEWGALVKYNSAQPKWVMTPYWAAEIIDELSYEFFNSLQMGLTKSMPSLANDFETDLAQVCVRNLDGSSVYPVPTISDLTLDGFTNNEGVWSLSYRFNNNGGAGDISTYNASFGSIGDGVTAVLRDYNVIDGTFNETTGLTMKQLEVTFEQASNEAEFTLRPVNSDFIVGEPISINTTMEYSEGNRLQKGLHSISTLKPNMVAKFDIKPLNDSDNFPKTGFIGAQFRVNIGNDNGINNLDYEWSAQLLDGTETDLVTVDQEGLVTMVRDPQQATPIAIIATHKVSGMKLRYEFKVEKWFYPDLPMPHAQFANIATPLVPIDTNMPGNDKSTFSVHSDFPTTGFVGAQFKLNVSSTDNLNTGYTWKSSDSKLVRVSTDGTVTLLADPGITTPITITATPKDGMRPTLSYTFTLKQWWEADF